MRVWRRLVPPTPPMDAQRKPLPTAAAAAPAPAPRAFHVSWAFDNNVYVHGGEGPVGGATSGNPEVDDILGGVGRDPFAEEDGGAPLESGRMVTSATAESRATAPGSSLRKNRASTDGATTVPKGRNDGNASSPSRVIAGVAPRRPAVSVLEDLWKLDTRTLLWERVRVDCSRKVTECCA